MHQNNISTNRVFGQSTIKLLVERRRISKEVIGLFQIQEDTKGWLYPIPGGGKRWKNFISDNSPKYRWHPRKPRDAKLYFGINLKTAINDNNGECWFVSGEADLWAIQSSGIRNSFSSFGENNIPDDLVHFLNELGIIKVNIAPDLDETGNRWANNLYMILKESNIKLSVFQLPEKLGDSADIGKAWKHFDDSQNFETWLKNLPKTTPISLVREEYNQEPGIPGKTSVPLQYRKIISRELGVFDYKADGNSKININCPFHDDEIPSASLHKEKGLHCFACGKTYLWIEIAEILGLPSLRQFLGSDKNFNYPLLSTETREKLIRMGCTSVARVYDAFYKSGILPGYPFTIKNAANLLSDVGIKSNTIYRVTNRSSEKYSQFFPSYPDLKEKEGKNKNQANKPREFILLSPKQIALMVGLSQKINHHYDLIPKEKISSAKEYKAEVYASLVRRKPGFYTRKELCERLNITAKTSRAYDKTANIKVTPREKATKLSRADIYRLPEKRNGIPGWYYLKAKEKRFAPTKSGAKRAFNHYKDVYLVRQLSNHYSG